MPLQSLTFLPNLEDEFKVYVIKKCVEYCRKCFEFFLDNLQHSAAYIGCGQCKARVRYDKYCYNTSSIIYTLFIYYIPLLKGVLKNINSKILCFSLSMLQYRNRHDRSWTFRRRNNLTFVLLSHPLNLDILSTCSISDICSIKVEYILCLVSRVPHITYCIVVLVYRWFFTLW